MLDHDVDEDAIARLADHLVWEHHHLLRKLIAMREKHGLTQAQVALRMGVSQPTVAAFERYDSNPTLATIRRYALAVEARIHEDVLDDRSERHAHSFQNVVNLSEWRTNTRRPAIQWATTCHG